MTIANQMRSNGEVMIGGSLPSAAVKEESTPKASTARKVFSPELLPPAAIAGEPWLKKKPSSRAAIPPKGSLHLELGLELEFVVVRNVVEEVERKMLSNFGTMPPRRRPRVATSSSVNEGDEVRGLVDSIGSMLRDVLDRVQQPRSVKKKDVFDTGAIEFKGAKGPLDAYTWVNKMEKAFESTNLPEEKKVKMTVTFLDDSTHHWWTLASRNNGGAQDMTWEQFKTLFLGRIITVSYFVEVNNGFVRPETCDSLGGVRLFGAVTLGIDSGDRVLLGLGLRRIGGLYRFGARWCGRRFGMVARVSTNYEALKMVLVRWEQGRPPESATAAVSLSRLCPEQFGLGSFGLGSLGLGS
ncbi:hypothetical protein ACLB2K_059858 [Fragaria x ananassa]